MIEFDKIRVHRIEVDLTQGHPALIVHSHLTQDSPKDVEVAITPLIEYHLPLPPNVIEGAQDTAADRIALAFQDLLSEVQDHLLTQLGADPEDYEENDNDHRRGPPGLGDAFEL